MSPLKVNEVLVNRRRMFGVFREPQPGHLLRLRHHRAAANPLKQVHDLAAMSDLVK